jgi:hypothetical protein
MHAVYHSQAHLTGADGERPAGIITNLDVNSNVASVWRYLSWADHLAEGTDLGTREPLAPT